MTFTIVKGEFNDKVNGARLKAAATNSKLRPALIWNLLPAAAGAAAAERASASTTETTATAAETSATESAAAPAAAPHAAGDQGADPPAAAAAASAPGAAATLDHDVHEENEHAQEDQTEQAAGILPVARAVRLRGWWRRAAERDAAILRDHIRDAAGEQRHACVVVSLTEIRDHLAAEAADFAVGQDGFQTVADLRPVFVVVHCEENQDAAGSLLRTDAPFA